MSYAVRHIHNLSSEPRKVQVTVHAAANVTQLLRQILHENSLSLARLERVDLRVFRPGSTVLDWKTPDEKKIDARLDPEDPVAPYIPGPEVTDGAQRRFTVLIVPSELRALTTGPALEAERGENTGTNTAAHQQPVTALIPLCPPLLLSLYSFSVTFSRLSLIRVRLCETVCSFAFHVQLRNRSSCGSGNSCHMRNCLPQSSRTVNQRWAGC